MQNRKEYNERYNAMVSRYEDTERKSDAVVEQIDLYLIRRRQIEQFIETVKDLPEFITEFGTGLWCSWEIWTLIADFTKTGGLEELLRGLALIPPR